MPVGREVKFAGAVIEINNEVVAKVTSYSRAVSIAEENVTGVEDVIPGTDVLHELYVSISVGETVSIEGIAIEDAAGLDSGQSELRDAAESGQMVDLRHVRNTGFGQLLGGFFTAYEESADTSGVYKFSGTMRVNTNTEITPGS